MTKNKKIQALEISLGGILVYTTREEINSACELVKVRGWFLIDRSANYVFVGRSAAEIC